MAIGKLRKSSGRASPIVDINMIPLIDVSLVLLIIFMVMTPFLVQQQIRINLPHSVTASEVPDRPIVILMQKEGGLSLDGHAVAAGSLESELQHRVSDGKEHAVVIQADRDIALQRVVEVMDIAKRLQVAKLGISVEQPKP